MWLVRKRPPVIKRMFKVFLDKKFDGTYINKVYQDGDILYANIHLPEHKELSDLEKLLPNLQQEVGATAVKLGKVSGKYVEILFGMNKLIDIDFDTSMLQPNTLKLRFPSAFGEYILDFEDGASCHLLNGGVTRMGKTCFLLYLATSIFLQNKGNVKLYISSVKLKDYYPFEGIPQIKMTRDIEGMIELLAEVMDEYKKRDDLLYSPSLKKATDAKSVRKLYPDFQHLFKPIFIIIDEYARFAESKIIQNMVTEIVETAGFVNVHVIIASQRPDAATVLRPRIRANLLCRMAFTTADRKNSEVILDREGAEKLGKIPGRGMVLDSDLHVVHVPYLDAVECDRLLEEYRNEQNTEGSIDTGYTGQIQSLQPESIGMDGLPGEFESDKRSQQGTETYDSEWLYHSDPEGKG
jgi:DNA segregation ATPase FtsK/SpoIIIE-like protein